MNTHGAITAFVLMVTFPLASCQRADTDGGPDGGGEKGKVRAPTFKYDKKKEGGCANVHLYKMTADQVEVLVIRADKEKLKLPAKGTVTFDLAKAPEGLVVAVDLWDKAPRFRAYCNDIGPDTKKEATWKAKKGKLTLTIFEPADKKGAGPRTYKVSAKLEGAVFDDGAGHEATLKQETITEATVGWYAG